jgi:hypothetical protein
VPIRAWISERHSLRVETATVLGLYAVYETVRGLVAGDATAAVDRAHAIARLEQQMHLFAEPTLQAAAHRVPGLLAVLGAAYVTLHLTVSAAVLLWLHRRRAAVFPVVRTTLLIASGLSLVLFVLVPTAPPRLAGIGVRDTVSGGTVDLNHGLVSSLYNPYAADGQPLLLRCRRRCARGGRQLRGRHVPYARAGTRWPLAPLAG